MWQALGLLLYIPLFTYCNRKNRSHSNGRANLYSAFAFSYGLYYFIIPFAIYIFGRKDMELRSVFENYVERGGMGNGMPWLFYYFYLFVIFLFFTLCYNNYKPKRLHISTSSF